MLELTSRCNLRCVHCYLGEQREQRGLEMPTERVTAVIDEIVAGGCLYLAITGGDPMVRRDFPEIYRHAREKGLIVTVLCDGVLVTEKIVDLFREYPPFNVDISLYGATAETYEAVTRTKGSYARCLRGIRRLLAAGIPVSLKTVLMSINQHELDDMRKMAEELGVSFRMDAALFPCLPNHDRGPLDLRVSPREAVAKELSDPERLQEWIEYAEQRRDQAPAEGLYVCGAGLTNFYIDPFGFVSPCLMTTQYRYSLGERDFAGLWADQLAELRRRTPRDSYTCNTCEMQTACTVCPAFNFQETGREDVKSEYVCETAGYRWQAIQEASRAAGGATRPLLPVLSNAASAGGTGGHPWDVRREE
ncbi:MAG: radical SAM protein [bacterium]|nr:radical SAM protein [bacterium]